MKLPLLPTFVENIDLPLRRVLDWIWQELVRVVNNVEFGSPQDGPININGAWIQGTTPFGANTEFSITHNLGRIPTGWLKVKGHKAADFYFEAGMTAWTETTMSLKCDKSEVDYILFII